MSASGPARAPRAPAGRGVASWWRARALAAALGGVVLGASAQAQNRVVIDSLQHAYRQSDTDSLRVHYLNRIAIAYIFSLPDSAEVYERRALATARAAGDSALAGQSLVMLGTVETFRGRPRQAIPYMEAGYALLTGAGRWDQAGKTLNNIARAHYQLENYPAALDAYLRAYPIQEAHGAPRNLATLEINIGGVYGAMDNPQRALTHRRRAVEILEGVPHRDLPGDERAVLVGEKVGAYRALGRSLIEFDRFEDAVRVLRRAERMAGSLGNDSRSGVLYSALARALRGTGDLGGAEASARRAVSVLSASPSSADYAGALVELGRVLEATGALGDAQAVAAEAVAAARRGEGQRALDDALRLSADLEEASADYRAAYLALAEVAGRSDSVGRAAQREAVDAVQAQFDVERAETRAEIEAQRAEIAEATSGRQRAWLVGAVLGLTLLATLAAGLFRTGRLRRRANALLASKNAEVERRRSQAETALGQTVHLLGEREVLLREVHHRVKNNLQVVASLVNLQSDTVDDFEARAALRQMRSRVEVMALVHRRLYGGDDLRTVDAAEYLGDLARLLAGAYADTCGEISVAAEPVPLDADAAVPLGLAAAELIANACEHGGGTDVRLSLTAPPGRLVMVVEDAGPGLPDGLDAPPPDSLGLQLASDLAFQLGGTFAMGRSADLGGARMALDVPAPEARTASVETPSHSVLPHVGLSHHGDGSSAAPPVAG